MRFLWLLSCLSNMPTGMCVMTVLDESMTNEQSALKPASDLSALAAGCPLFAMLGKVPDAALIYQYCVVIYREAEK